MNKKQKILVLLCLGLILLLTGTLIKTAKALDVEDLATEEYLQGIAGTSTPQTAVGRTAEQMQTEDQTIGALTVTQYIAAVIGGYLVKVVAYLTNFSIKLNFDILNNYFITNGWRICRDFANLGFVLFIIIIAIATILRYQEYAAKSTLAKLIAVALLVNFSLLGAGVFVDFSNMLTRFFITSATNDPTGNLANSLAAAFNPGKFLETASPAENPKLGDMLKGFFAKYLKAVLVWIASLFFVIIFTLLLAFILFALAIMFLIRYIILCILLVLVPLACLFWVIPATKSLWDKWWHEFIRWVLFAPAAAFFVFLTISMVNNAGYKNQLSNLSDAAQGTGANALNATGTIVTANGNKIALEGVVNASLPMQIANMVVIIGFLLGGLIVANKLSIHGSKAAYGAAKGGLKGFGAWAGRKGVRTAGWAVHPSDRMLNWANNPNSGKTKQFVGKTMYKIQSGLSKVPGAKQIGQTFRGATPAQDKKIHKNVWASTIGGMKSGSGLFKKKKQQYTIAGYKEGEPILEEAEKEEGEEKKPKEEKT